MRSLDSINDKNRRKQIVLDWEEQNSHHAKILREYEIQLEKIDKILNSLKEEAKKGIDKMETPNEVKEFNRNYIQRKEKKIIDVSNVELAKSISENYSIRDLLPSSSMYFSLFALYILFFICLWFMSWIRQSLTSNY